LIRRNICKSSKYSDMESAPAAKIDEIAEIASKAG
jgi:hypothetical protein